MAICQSFTGKIAQQKDGGLACPAVFLLRYDYGRIRCARSTITLDPVPKKQQQLAIIYGILYTRRVCTDKLNQQFIMLGEFMTRPAQ